MYEQALQAVFILMLFTAIAPVIGFVARKARVERVVGFFAFVGFLTAFFYFYQALRSSTGSLIYAMGPLTSFTSYFEFSQLSLYFAAIFTGISAVVALYSLEYMKHDTGQTIYYTLLLGMITGMVCLVLSADLFTFFVYWEIMCITSYCLVGFRKRFWEPVEAGFKYLVMSTVGSILFLYAFALIYGSTGTLNIRALSSHPAAFAVPFVFAPIALVIAGFGVKASMVPFHTWLPDAHPAAPSSISALLSGIVVVTGIYGIMRLLLTIFHPFHRYWGPVLMVFAIVTMFVGNLTALMQDDIKRLLAYSTIAHMGYILYGVSLGTLQGATASLLHILNHAIAKALLFLFAGILIHHLGTRSLEELTGAARGKPFLAVPLFIGALSLAGVPPLNGFWSELLLVLSGFNAAGTMGIAAPLGATLLLINVAIAFAYYLRLLLILVFREGERTLEKPSRLLVLCTWILAAMCVVIGLYPWSFIQAAEIAGKALLITAP